MTTKRDPVSHRVPTVSGTPRDPVSLPLKGDTRGTRPDSQAGVSRRQPIINSTSALEHLTGRCLPGGCDDCDSYQIIRRVHGRFYVLTVHHDETCPELAKGKGAR